MISKLKLTAILGWLIAGTGVFTFVYILARAIGKIGGAYIGGKLTKAPPVVTKYLGFTLLPHSGVSLVFTGIATTLSSFDSSLARIVSGTIVAAAIINEIIAVIVANTRLSGQEKLQNSKNIFCKRIKSSMITIGLNAMFISNQPLFMYIKCGFVILIKLHSQRSFSINIKYPLSEMGNPAKDCPFILKLCDF